MDGLIEASLDQTARASLGKLRHRWRVIKSMDESKAATNGRGDLKLESFIASYRRKNNSYRIGYDNSDFSGFIDTARAVMFPETGSSGTVEGIGSMLGKVVKDEMLGQIPGGSMLR
ncbi:hypothetical protein C1J03_19050 [Sulfitobacter sp. SK012]|nr:hypothetical protein C1J03_19050 [Sulfitobacter sp. SK012]